MRCPQLAFRFEFITLSAFPERIRFTMASSAEVRFPPRVLRSLQKFGSDVEIARKKRRLTVEALCSRAGISRPLYSRMVRGAPGTSASAIAMVLFALGCGTPFDDLLDVAKDDTGLLLDQERLPVRVRPPRKSGAL
ncbi:helix-turn-helix domain-containing protein [Roseateles sp. L2-2]|uniref:helix-turn-helix domain-containing protein n=1 Tax=Roseateles sp. L2-2 TaxID=3422597 RepID=UPI003D3683BB